MNNEMLDRLTGHSYPPFFPDEILERWWRHRLFRPSVRERWMETCREAARSDQLEELHAVRESYLRVLQGYSLMLKGTLVLYDDGDEHGPGSERLRQNFEDVESLRTELTARWVTPDDLYTLVAGYVAPSAEHTSQLAAHTKPPQAWYDEDADPFSPAE